MPRNAKLAVKFSMSALVAVLTLSILEVPALHASLTPDGQVQIEGDDGWTKVLAHFDGTFLKTHPDFGRKLPVVLKGSSGATAGAELGISASIP